jgi:hypothetical protein
VWSVAESARVFVTAVQRYLDTRAAEMGSATFDKDDDLAGVCPKVLSTNLEYRGALWHKDTGGEGAVASVVQADPASRPPVVGGFVLKSWWRELVGRALYLSQWTS